MRLNCLCLAFFVSIASFAQKPEDSRFTVNTLVQGLDEPMELTSLPDGRILLVERKGALKLYDPALDYLSLVATIDCNTKYTNATGHVREAEEGLMGIVVDPNFEKNNWIYIYYADPEETQHILTRWEFKEDELVDSSRKVVLKVKVQRLECCHTGGGMDFDTKGNLYITVGNNTSNGGSAGYAPLDERPGREPWDDQRGAGNMNDLRGSVLRIKPLDDGTYAIPEGNLSPVGTPNTRPEIYAKGARNPWRPTIDTKTNYLYWGEVGPDAPETTDMGPAGYDEFNQAKKAGFFGWPYFSANNKPYRDLNFETGEKGELFNLESPINDSPNNTGPQILPSPTPAFIWYPYNLSEQFPLLGVSGRSATGVAIFHNNDFKKPERLWPAYYADKLLISDFMRGWLMSVTMDDNSDYVSMERFLPQENFSSLIDMEFAPNGDLYFLKYGSSWFAGADNSALARIEYNAGNRPPVAKHIIDKKAGKLPLTVNLDASETKDADGDKLSYSWEVKLNNKIINRSNDIKPSFIFDKPGVYILKLVVIDNNGGSSKIETEIKAGNSTPEINIELTDANRSFYFANKAVKYHVRVKDAEDGDSDLSEILPAQVAVNVDYMPETFDPIEISSNYATADSKARFNTGFKLISKSDCGSCHRANSTSIGPSYMQVSERYKTEKGALEKLAAKIISGGEGVWGDHAMAAHPQFSDNQSKAMVSYILSFADPELEDKKSNITSTIKTIIPKNETGFGGYVIRAAYTDQGAKKVSPIFTEKITYLPYPFLDPREHDSAMNTENVDTPTKILQFFGKNAYLGFKNIDLTYINNIQLLIQSSRRTSSAGGIIEIRTGSPTGPIIGKTEFLEVADNGEVGNLLEAESNKKIRKEQERRMGEGAAEYFLGRSRVIEVPIKATIKIDDLYFVAVSPKADENQIVLSFSGIQFNQK
jgi:cytochrome c